MLGFVCSLASCSFAFSRVPEQPQASDECPGLGAPFADLVMVPVSATLGVFAVRGLFGEETNASAALGGMAIAALPWLASSIFGFVQRGRCTKRLSATQAPPSLVQ